MSRTSYSALAIGGAALAIVLFSWIDTNLVRDAQRQASGSFDPVPATSLSALIGVALVATILGLAVAAWRSRSALAGALYAVIGAVLAFLLVILFTLAVGRNGSPPALPEPLVRLINDLVFATVGPMNAVGLIGAGMLVIGLALLARSVRGPAGYRTRPRAAEAPDSAESN